MEFERPSWWILRSALLNEVITTRFPDDALDLLFAVGAQIFSEAVPYMDRSPALGLWTEVKGDPVAAIHPACSRA